MKERRDSGLEGFLKEGIQERRETRKEGSEQEVCGAVKMLHTHTRDTGKVECWTQVGPWDAGLEGCRTRGIQERRNAGNQRCRQAGMQEPRDSRDEGCKFGSEMALIEKTTILI